MYNNLENNKFTARIIKYNIFVFFSCKFTTNILKSLHGKAGGDGCTLYGAAQVNKEAPEPQVNILEID